jgi:hypothetical protein
MPGFTLRQASLFDPCASQQPMKFMVGKFDFGETYFACSIPYICQELKRSADILAQVGAELRSSACSFPDARSRDADAP